MSFKSIKEYSSVLDMLLKYNNVDTPKMHEYFPENSLKSDININDYINFASKLKMQDNFIDFISSNKDKKYCIIGDYDCDGIFATVIMALGLSVIGLDVSYITPNKLLDGYGMKNVHIDKAKELGCDVIITVDNGITAFDPIDYAHKLGIKVIVTDHHKPDLSISNNADIIINPKYNEDEFMEISGATVAFKLIRALFESNNLLNNKFLNYFCAFAGITAISDVMPLIGENRMLVKGSIKFLNNEIKENSDGYIDGTAFADPCNNIIVGLVKLSGFYLTYVTFDEDGIAQQDIMCPPINAFNVPMLEYYFIPIINAVSRVIGNAELLVSDIINICLNPSHESETNYVDINKTRRSLTTLLYKTHVITNDLIVFEALNPIDADMNYNGIVGLMAASIVNDEGKPAIVGMNNGDDYISFSARSIPGFSLYNCLGRIKTKYPDLGLMFGGHDMALGGKIKYDDTKLFQEYLNEDFKQNYIPVEEQETIIETDNISPLIAFYKLFRPYGNNWYFPKLRVISTVMYYDGRKVHLSNFKSFPVVCYNTSYFYKIVELLKYNQQFKIDFILNISEDRNDFIYCTIDKILNISEIELEIESKKSEK